MQAVAGHADPGFTLRVYCKAVPANLVAAVAQGVFPAARASEVA
ncbi:MAG: hypothetical protein ACLPSH_08245 [Vulcanimicrobiaceae bacterium]